MNNQKAFTLIELLVVVLIIGILAAVALPQYQKAVEKARATQAITVVTKLYQAAEAYELASGNWPSSLEELAIEIPQIGDGTEWKIGLDNNVAAGAAGVGISRLRGKYTGTSLIIYKRYPYSDNIIPKGKILCKENQRHASTLYSGERGSYCQKILKGTATYVGENNWSNIWVLP